MATSTAIPVEEYLRRTYEPDMEYVAGQLVERHVGEYFHGFLQGLLVVVLSGLGRGRFRVFPETRIRVSDEPRYRIPDICVKRLPHEIAPVLEQPDLVIEVLSPDDDPAEVLTKVGEYLHAGIPHIWIVDPYKRTLVEADGAGIRRPAGTILATDLVGAVDFADLFRQLDEPANG
jgi:Uma2 family endonuclease